jgi:hypothetical protein
VRANPDVVGLVLTGSRGRDAFVRETSDWDVRLVVRDESYAEVAETLATGHGSPIEVVVYSLAAFERVGEPGTETAWDRYSYVHGSVLVDKLDGRIGQIVAGKAVLPEGIGPGLAAFELDGYVNAYYRSLKNDRAGLVAGAHLDAAESIPPLLTTVFAVHDRVRPFNRFLAWELERFPLPEPWLAHDRFVPRLEAILRTGSIRDQASLFRDVEAFARSHDLGETIDSWEPDVPWLRSGKPG